MKTKAIRILDTKNGVVCVNLLDILSEIHNEHQFYWSILFLNASGHLGEGKSILELEKQINKSEKGLFINWEDLNSLAKKFWEVVDILIIGCKNSDLLIRYEDDQEMYETCDIVIEMFDSCFWEVFSKDEELISKLAAKFKEIKFLESDFLK